MIALGSPHLAPPNTELDHLDLMNLIDELAQLTRAGGRSLTSHALAQRSLRFRASPARTWSELSDRRAEVLNCAGLLDLLDIGLSDPADQLRAEVIVDQLWTGAR